ncbi:MAG: hypothetical protein NC403_08435 [Muribaculaceae bacterium]|nr:hypothetical protein [Muribaculaceae bacterium]
MKTTKLQPKCSDLLYQLIERAEKQLREAYNIYRQLGEFHWYTATGDNGKQVQWKNCISSHCTVIRENEQGELVAHHKGECWLPLQYYRQDVLSLCQCADNLLEKAYALRNGQN